MKKEGLRGMGCVWGEEENQVNGGGGIMDNGGGSLYK